MELPSELGRIEFGTIKTQSVEVAQGLLTVEALGYFLHIGHERGEFRSYWLLPRRVTLARPDGQVERAPVRDGAGRVSLVLTLAGLAVTLICLALSRK